MWRSMWSCRNKPKRRRRPESRGWSQRRKRFRASYTPLRPLRHSQRLRSSPTSVIRSFRHQPPPQHQHSDPTRFSNQQSVLHLSPSPRAHSLLLLPSQLQNTSPPIRARRTRYSTKDLSHHSIRRIVTHLRTYSPPSNRSQLKRCLSLAQSPPRRHRQDSLHILHHRYRS